MGFLIRSTLPAVLTNDIAGIVTALGSNVSKFAIGDHVFTQAAFGVAGSPQNGLQEYAVTDVPFTAKAPEGFSDDQMATIPTNIIAPLVALFEPSLLNIPAPWTDAAKNFDYAAKTLLVVGGGSNCGKFAVQLASLAGIGKIVVVASMKNEKEL